MKVMSFKVSEDMRKLIIQEAKKRNLTVSELVRRAVMEYITKHEQRVIATRKIKIYL